MATPPMSKQQLVANTLSDLIESECGACPGLSRIQDGLAYKAPELMDHTWLCIHDLLERKASENAAAKDIWNKACTVYSNLESRRQ